ncbi:hypothetical protein WH47_00489 [Habropoda laboriosa]|uniref:C2H2-type domain-containing protein n=1 Tax=Habropoda laboriosa TaxID=597456 RepID=A0A0L7R3W3_9HYME|nr:PREDICTED: uncharacterized protein LOC108572151 [Habropoda laboriosa]KOC65519.1 hypothetical protein WH47_00489 [Habropoda laboriosa]
MKTSQKVYTCSSCKYQSTRLFNVERHMWRIHTNEKRHTCCGKKFVTKGDYYVHCEQKHPKRRVNAIMSRTKYKITRDTTIIHQSKHKSKLRKFTSETKKSYRMKLRSKFLHKSVRMRNYQEQSESNTSMECSVTYSEIDVEDIPLIRFLTDRRLKSYWSRLFSSKLVNKTNDKSMLEEESNPSVKIAISSERRNIDEAASEGGLENDLKKVSTSLTSSVSSSFSVELPAKKLILRRFRTSVTHEYTQQCNNNSNQGNLEQKQLEEIVSETVQSRTTKNYKRAACKAEKENMSTYAFSLEQQLNIKLDRGIATPLVTQMQRDFLASIDFENYKIF